MTDQTLLEQLAVIDEALLGGTATPGQETRGQQLIRLMDASQELYDALEYFYNIMCDYHSSVSKGYVEFAMEQARTALAKAKGGAI